VSRFGKVAVCFSIHTHLLTHDEGQPHSAVGVPVDAYVDVCTVVEFMFSPLHFAWSLTIMDFLFLRVCGRLGASARRPRRRPWPRRTGLGQRHDPDRLRPTASGKGPGESVRARRAGRGGSPFPPGRARFKGISVKFRRLAPCLGSSGEPAYSSQRGYSGSPDRATH
jgi:hypothetical protein